MADDDLPSLDLQSGGVVTGGVIQDTGDGLTADGGTLNNVTYEGALNVGNGSIFIDDDITLTGLTGTGAGAITVDDGYLYLDNSQTLDNATITLTTYATLQQYTTYAAYEAAAGTPNETLTFGANLVIDQASGTGFISAGGYSSTNAIVNDGEIETQGTGSELEIYPESFTNAGTLDVGGTTTTLRVYATHFANTGTIDVASGDTFQLGGSSTSYTTASALGGAINAASGTIELDDGLLDNTGATLSIGAGSNIGAFYLYGGGAVVTGGIIKDGGSGLQSYFGTLDDVTFEGALNLQGYLYVDDGTTFTGVGGTGAGSLTLAGGQLLIENTQALDDATVTLEGGATLEQYTTYAAYQAAAGSPTETLTLGANLLVDATSGGYISNGGDPGTSSIVNDGELEAEGSTLYVNSSVFTNDNLIEAQAGGRVYFYSGAVTNISSDAHYSGGDVLTGGTYAAADGPSNAASEIDFEGPGDAKITTLAAKVDITGANSKIVSSNITLDDSLDDIASSGTLNLYYSAVSNTRAFFDDAATTLFVDGSANIYGSTLEAGSITIDSAGVVTGVGESDDTTPEIAEIEAPVTNDGVIVAGVAGGGNPSGDPEARFEIVGPVSGTGKFEIQGNTIAELSGASHGQSIIFENTETAEPATLQIDTTSVGTGASPKFTSAISGFEQGDDVIDLAHLNYANLTGHAFNGTTLSLTFSGPTTSASLTFAGLNAGDTFKFSADSGSGMDITLACYVRGARIATPDGEVAIEHLREGDLVLTASGATRPVRWTGHRRIDVSRHRTPAAVRPVRVSAHAFGEGLPRRDLWLSPWHNVACEGVLMPILALANAISITEVDVREVEYWHVELDAHYVILAEGLPSESYLDTGNRTAFVNGGAFIEAHPDFAPKHWADTCLPLVQQGPEVVKTKARLLDILRARGVETTSDSDAHILADGRRIEPTFLSSTRLQFVLPSSCRDIVLASRRFTPAHVRPESDDTRELGLCIAKLCIDGVDLPLAHDELFEAGWRDAESEEGCVRRRWTAGAARLPSGANAIFVEFAGAGYYWREAAMGRVARAV